MWSSPAARAARSRRARHRWRRRTRRYAPRLGRSRGCVEHEAEKWYEPPTAVTVNRSDMRDNREQLPALDFIDQNSRNDYATASWTAYSIAVLKPRHRRLYVSDTAGAARSSGGGSSSLCPRTTAQRIANRTCTSPGALAPPPSWPSVSHYGCHRCAECKARRPGKEGRRGSRLSNQTTRWGTREPFRSRHRRRRTKNPKRTTNGDSESTVGAPAGRSPPTGMAYVRARMRGGQV